MSNNSLSEWTLNELQNGLSYFNEALVNFNKENYDYEYEAEKQLGYYTDAFNSIANELMIRENM